MRYVLLLACSSLTACVGVPVLEVSPPQSGRYTSEPLPNVAIQTAPGFDEQWWRRFNSPQLDETVAAALAGNRSLAIAQANLKQAQELLASAHGSRLPSVELAASGGRQKYGAAFLGAADFAPFTAYSIGANINYVLDYAGGVRNGIQQRLALTEVRQYSLQAAQLALVGNVVLQALEIASARDQIHAVESIVSEDRENMDLVRKAIEEGSVARVDLLTAQSQYAQDQTLLPPLRQALSVAQHALAVLVGQPPGNWQAADFELADFAPLADIPLVLPSQLAQRRPDIRADEARVRAAAAAVGIATANLYPQLKLSGSLSQQALTAGALFDEGSTAFALLGNLTAPLFNGGRLRAERRAAIAAGEAAVAQYEQTVLSAFGQIADVLTALEHDAEQIAAEEQALSAAESSLSSTRESYSAGNGGVLQILDAERSAQRARMGVVRAHAQRIKDTAELMVGLGGEAAITR